MRLGSSLALALALTLPAPAADAPGSGKFWAFFGTYTGEKSKGVYRAEFDAATGKLGAPELAAELKNPTFLALSPDGKTLYAVAEISGQGPKKNEGGVHSFSVDAATGKLTKINERTTAGAGPCHVAVHPGGGLVLVANYGGGSWALYTAAKDGTLSEAVATAKLVGSGANPGRQKEPHAHSGVFYGQSGFAVVDLGTDKVWTYNFDPNAGKAVPTAPVVTPPGSGPRHIDFAAGQKVAYVCGELDSTVNVVEFDAAAGTGKVVQTLSTLPGGKPVKGNSTAEVRVHPSGKWVYVSNRGHNSIAAFKVADGGKLDPEPVGWATEGINIPRNFNIDPTGKWMLVASQAGNDVAVFAIDPATGLPKPTGEKVAVGGPVCVKFLPKP